MHTYDLIVHADAPADAASLVQARLPGTRSALSHRLAYAGVLSDDYCVRVESDSELQAELHQWRSERGSLTLYTHGR